MPKLTLEIEFDTRDRFEYETPAEVIVDVIQAILDLLSINTSLHTYLSDEEELFAPDEITE